MKKRPVGHFTKFEVLLAKQTFGRTQAYKTFLKMILASPAPGKKMELFNTIHTISGNPVYLESINKFVKLYPKNPLKFSRDVRNDFFSKVNTFTALINLRKDLNIPEKIITNTLRVKNTAKYSEAVFKNFFVIKKLNMNIRNISNDAVRELSSPEIIYRLLAYHTNFADDKTKNNAFSSIMKAYLERGAEGLRVLKFSQAEKIMDNRTAGFLADVNKAVGVVRGHSGAETSIYSMIKQRLEDFRSYSSEIKFSEIIDAERKKALELAGGINRSINLGSIGINSKSLEQNIKSGNISGIEQTINSLKKGTAGKAEKARNALMGGLLRLRSSFYINSAVELVGELSRLNALSTSDQYRQLDILKKKYGEENIRGMKALFADLGRHSQKPIYGAMEYFMSTVLEPPRAGGVKGSVEAHISFSLKELFSVGTFQNNCININKTTNSYLLTSIIEPSEFAIAFRSAGRLEGFSLVHILKGDGGNYFLIENPYTDNLNLRDAMANANREIAEKVNQAAQKSNIGISAGIRQQLSGKSVESYPSIWDMGKYYDCVGGGGAHNISGNRHKFVVG